MTGDFGAKYGAQPFDENDANDALAEAVRRATLSGIAPVVTSDLCDASPRKVEMILAGALVGLTQVMQACVKQSDEADAAIRASIIQATPWAVDLARAQRAKPPLADM